MDLNEVDSCPPTPAPPPPTPPGLTTPTTPAEDLYDSPSSGLFGGPRSPVVTHYRKGDVPAGPAVVPPATIPEGRDHVSLCLEIIYVI